MLFFFFFQAEDGIRDIGVTGGQTWLFRSWFRNILSKTEKPFLYTKWATENCFWAYATVHL